MMPPPYLIFLRLFFRYLNAAVFVLCTAGVGFVLGALDQLGRMIPSSEELSAFQPRLTTEVYSTEIQRDGTEHHTLLARVFKEDREPIQLADIPKQLIDATVAIEDRRFWQHHGVSLRDMARAAWVDLLHREIVQGASTITQQLVRNTWLTNERTWHRKLKEAMLALEVERKYSKDEIIEMYLNQVCYGHGAFGVKTAARLYYGKAPSELKLHECAMLAGLPQWPVGYSPYHYPQRCKKRRNTVLEWMRREGYITAQEYNEATEAKLCDGLQPLKERGIVARQAPHFTNLVIRQLCNDYGEEAVYQGGLRVYTTLDLRVQAAAEQEMTRGVERLRRNRQVLGGLIGQGALACVEVRTGRVLAMVGGVGPFEKVQYNRAAPGPPRYGRQPGSSFKPYIWATALEHGLTPNSTVSGGPITIRLVSGELWHPKNYSPRQGGTYTLRRALAESVNLVSVRLVQKLGIPRVRAQAARMLNIPVERLRPVWALALGVCELSPLEQATGYCAFANGGLRPTARLIRRIENYDGQVLVSYEPELERVIQPETADDMLSMLQYVVEAGTGTRARSCGLPCGGKTGTTNSGRDVWFVGFTPDLSAAVWVGNDNNAPMPSGSGGGFCAPIWAAFIKRASEILGCKGEFPVIAGRRRSTRAGPSEDENPETIMVCTETGQRATENCPATREVVLEAGKRPPSYCRLHRGATVLDDTTLVDAGDTRRSRSVRVCASSGMLATSFCPATTTRRLRAGEEPGGYCTQHGPWSADHTLRTPEPVAGEELPPEPRTPHGEAREGAPGKKAGAQSGTAGPRPGGFEKAAPVGGEPPASAPSEVTAPPDE